MKIKIRILKFYIESVFLYNLELWTLTKLLVNKIDIFQRGVCRKSSTYVGMTKSQMWNSIEDTNPSLGVK